MFSERMRIDANDLTIKTLEELDHVENKKLKTLYNY